MLQFVGIINVKRVARSNVTKLYSAIVVVVVVVLFDKHLSVRQFVVAVVMCT